MATNPQNQAEGNYDPAGSTQMFRAFVDEGAPPQPAGSRRAAAPQPAGSRRAASGGPSVGLIVGVIVAILVVVGAAWLALG
ncbi:hypothetical protein ACWIG3_03260 [Streptomyces celluloflavus]|uniref:SPOR domain-containing protein n=1 Tax=Streptomyces celluloflavus TaxID=58344 RepID=A0ABW7RDU3_9ACTN|nr:MULTISPECIES: hypothetical protein [Streptomyces]MYU56435.1 hypothetical protein [Streptomyces sp. SID7805]WSK13503.1 hypothetical protein OG717_18085 [Streptomyces celluloflavus]